MVLNIFLHFMTKFLNLSYLLYQVAILIFHSSLPSVELLNKETKLVNKMSENSLWEIISKCKENDNDSFSLLCEKFNPFFRKYSRLLEYEDAYEDLLYCL